MRYTVYVVKENTPRPVYRTNKLSRAQVAMLDWISFREDNGTKSMEEETQGSDATKRT